MCNKSESISKIASALVAFSGEVKSIEKDGTNPHFKSAYTTLDHMIDETKPLLHKHGLTVMQFPGGDGEKITVRTMILHTSGEWIESEPLILKAVKFDPQGAGSAITYARRYSYAAALSLSLGDDDDGNSSSYQPQQRQASQPHYPNQTPQEVGQQRLQQEQERAARNQASANTPLISEAQVKYVHKLKSDKGIPEDDFKRLVAELGNGKSSVKELTKHEASSLINLLTNYAA